VFHRHSENGRICAIYHVYRQRIVVVSIDEALSPLEGLLLRRHVTLGKESSQAMALGPPP
jgi:hypothetical protein